jgi:hypothetical protein
LILDARLAIVGDLAGDMNHAIVRHRLRHARANLVVFHHCKLSPLWGQTIGQLTEVVG